MNEQETQLQSLETFTVSVVGDDIPECRARAWDELQKTLGKELARDPVHAWVATKLLHGPNPERFRTSDDGEQIEDESKPPFACSAEFTREEPPRAKFA